MKRWVTRKGKLRQGSLWSKNSIYILLNNRKYIGEITHYGEAFAGEQEPIIDNKIWDQVQEIFRQNSHVRARETVSQTPALLKGILACGHCNCSMGLTYTRKNNRTYRYYQCLHASKHGYDTCPVKSVPAGDTETMVIDRLREILRSPEVLAKAHLAYAEAPTPPDLQAFARALQDVDAVWEHLFPLEQARIFQLLLERVTISTGGIDVRLRSCGIVSLVGELTSC